MIDPTRFSIARDIGRAVFFRNDPEAPGEQAGSIAGRAGEYLFIKPSKWEGKGKAAPVRRVPFGDVRFAEEAWGDSAAPASENSPQPPQSAPAPLSCSCPGRDVWAACDWICPKHGRMSADAWNHAPAESLPPVDKPVEIERPEIVAENVTAARSQYHPASLEAFEKVRGIVSERCWTIIALFNLVNEDWICDEIETALGWSHQSTSSLITLLKKRGILYEAQEGGKPLKRNTRSGAAAHVLRLAPRDKWDLTPDAKGKGIENESPETTY